MEVARGEKDSKVDALLIARLDTLWVTVPVGPTPVRVGKRLDEGV